MANQYFDWPSKPLNQRFIAYDTVRSQDVNAAFDAVSAGFALLPTPLALNSASANFALDTGSANTYVVSIAPSVILAYAQGLTVMFKAATGNLGASTVNVNGLGAAPLVLADGSALGGGQILAGQIIVATYISASGSFQLLAASTFNQLDKRYLGAKSADPTTDNQGQALTVGAMYLNPSVNAVRFWTGAAWLAIAGLGASSVTNTAAGNIAATDVQSAINELDAEKIQSVVYATGGTSTAYTLTPTPAVASYAAAVGKSWLVQFAADSGDQPTFGISGLGSPPNAVKLMPDGTYANIRTKDIISGLRSWVTLLATNQLLVHNLSVMPSTGVFNIKTFAADFTLDYSDNGAVYEHNNATPHTVTIPTNAAKPLPPGFTVTIIVAPGAGAVSVACADTLIWLGPNTSGSPRTISVGGSATIIKSKDVGTRNYISGNLS